MDGRDAARGGEIVLWAAGAIYLCGEAGGYLLPLITTDTGRAMLAAALASLLVGGVIMRQLSQVEA